jgi:hypothetical protein
MINYYKYLESKEWKETKIRYLKSKFPNDCAVCGKIWSNSFVFHHKTYKRLGREWLMDIAPVCRPCHEVIHSIYNNQKGGGLWGCLKIARRRVGRSAVALKAKGKSGRDAIHN